LTLVIPLMLYYSPCPNAEDERCMMGNAKSWLLEMRVFTLRPGTRSEFDRISREGTIPLMRQLGITVIAHGPSNNENGYFLLRAFPSESERIEQSQALYTTPEWVEKYDASVMAMIEEYDTAVMPVLPDSLRQLAETA
jgi:hypothetical protein